jgi:AraC-like DNA-binding protein
MQNNQFQEGLFLKNEDRNGNKIIYSQLRNWERQNIQTRFLSIKYVLAGTESYSINRSDHNVNSGQYLLINAGQSYHGYFKSDEPVRGMCFYLDHRIISDVYKNQTLGHGSLLDDPGGTIAADSSIDIYEDVYNAKDNPLGTYLASLGDTLATSQKPLLMDENEVYYSLANKLLETQHVIHNKISLIRAERYATRKELYRRIHLGKQMIDAYYHQNIEIEDIAEQATLSQFHFFRTFKQVFKISPYQYLIRLRLKNALLQLEQGRHSITEIAYTNGFADIHSFSKSFKKVYRYAPTKYLHFNKSENEK